MLTYTLKRYSVAALSAAGFALFGTIPGLAETAPLMVNGAVASSSVRTIQGQIYVPLHDVAKALNLRVVERNGKYELIPAGGTTQIANKNVGKMGDEIFTGQWRFKVTQIEYASHYRKQLTPYFRNEIQAQASDELVIVHCRVKNGTKAKDSLVYENWEGCNTALTDSEGHSYEPTLWDVRADQIAPEGAAFLPGAAIDFVLVFNVPKKTTLKDLIFTAMRYSERVSYDQKKHPPTDIRYHLQ